jgi:hypothetical protein
MTVRFDDLETLNGPVNGPSALPATLNEVSRGSIHVEDCPKCNGTGHWRGGWSLYGRECFKCKGTGKLSFKTDATTRTKNRAAAAARKTAIAANAFLAFEAKYPAIAAWWNNTDFEFALAMKEAVRRYGDLTERQLAAVQRCLEAAEKRQATFVQRQIEFGKKTEAAPVIRINAVADALARAKEKGIRAPKLRLAGANRSFVLMLASPNGKNAGAIYVKDKETDDYYGKILGGKFIRSRDCSEVIEAEIVAACADPEQAAVAYGRRFGICSCCGRELTNALSIKLGIGPICRGKFF